MPTKLAAGALSAMLLLAFAPTPARADDGEEPAAGFRLLQLEGSGVRWAGPRDGRAPSPVVTYAFLAADTRFHQARNCRSMTSLSPLLAQSNLAMGDIRRETRAAFDMWQRAARIAFQEIGDAARADIVIGAEAEPLGHAFTDVQFRPGGGPVRDIARSLICLNPKKRWKIGFDGNLAVYDLRYTIAHEIGHAIGLDHPDDNHTLMSFRYREEARELRPGDIEGAVALYGPAPAPVVAGAGAADAHAAAAAPATRTGGGTASAAPPSGLAIGQPAGAPVSP